MNEKALLSYFKIVPTQVTDDTFILHVIKCLIRITLCLLYTFAWKAKVCNIEYIMTYTLL